MAMDWFRSWHNAPTDPKWLLISKRANVPPGMVSAVFWALLDHASQEKERGSIVGFDVETYAGWAGWEESAVQSIIDAMRSKGIITSDNRLAAWEKRQVKREDETGADRQAKHRDSKRNASNAGNTTPNDVTQSNAKSRGITHKNARLDKTRSDEIIPERVSEHVSSSNGNSHDDDLIDPEVTEAISKWKETFAKTPWEGNAPVDRFYRWLAFGGPDVLCHMIEQAKGKDNPTGYLYTTYDNWRKDGEVAPHVSRLVAGKTASAAPLVPATYTLVFGDGSTETKEVLTRGA